MFVSPHARIIAGCSRRIGIGPVARIVGVIAALLLSSAASGHTPPPPVPASPKDEAREAISDTPAAAPTSSNTGDAEKILTMSRLLASDRKQKEKYIADQVTLQERFNLVAADFERIDVELSTARAKLEKAADDAERETFKKSLDRLERSRTRKRDEFELIIARRKAVLQQLVTLDEKIALVEDYLERLSSPSAGLAPLSMPGSTPAATTPSAGPPVTAPASKPSPISPLIPGLPSLGQEGAPATAAPGILDPDAEQYDEDLKAARRVRLAKLAAQKEAEIRIARMEKAVEVFERDLTSSRELLKLAEKTVEASAKSVKSIDARLKERRAAGENEEDLLRLRTRRDEIERRLEGEREDMEAQADRVAKSEAVLERLKKSRIEAKKNLVERDDELEAADRKVWFLSSPIAPYQLTSWFSNKGPRVLIVIIGSIALYWGAKLVGSRVVGKVVRRSSRGGKTERENRAETLRRVFDSTAGVSIVVLGILSALNQAGINVTVLLGGAAVVGAALAFGSQNLIKDYFSGFMILMENQYSVGNVIKVGTVTGTVENITLRMTSIRDLEGILHFMPHSQVLSVSNLTYGWSRIVMDIKVSSAEDPDRVIETLVDVGRELKKDTVFGAQVIGEPEMLGVDSLAGSAILIKLLVKTKPLNRWPVKREMLRRIKKRFDAEGIKMA